MDIDPERIVRSPFLVGALGAIVAMKSAPGETWPVRAFNLLCGALLAGYMSPAVAEYFALASPSQQAATSFGVGLFGMNFVSASVLWIKQLQLSDVLPWLRRKD